MLVLKIELAATGHIEDVLVFLMVHHALILLGMLLVHGHIAHGGKQSQLVTAPIAYELTVRVLNGLGLIELDLRQLGLRPLVGPLSAAGLVLV